MNKAERPVSELTAGAAAPGKPKSAASEPLSVPNSSYELHILQSLRRIIRAVEIHSRKLSQRHHITGPQLACLPSLQDSGALLPPRPANNPEPFPPIRYLRFTIAATM